VIICVITLFVKTHILSEGAIEAGSPLQAASVARALVGGTRILADLCDRRGSHSRRDGCRRRRSSRRAQTQAPLERWSQRKTHPWFSGARSDPRKSATFADIRPPNEQRRSLPKPVQRTKSTAPTLKPEDPNFCTCTKFYVLFSECPYDIPNAALCSETRTAAASRLVDPRARAS
jgi:hypothetical protein